MSFRKSLILFSLYFLRSSFPEIPGSVILTGSRTVSISFHLKGPSLRIRLRMDSPVFIAFLRNLRCFLIAYMWTDCSNYTDAVLYQLTASLFIGCDSCHTVVNKMSALHMQVYRSTGTDSRIRSVQIAFSSSCPPSAAIVIVTSFPMMLNATWFTTSGMTGFTFPGHDRRTILLCRKVDLTKSGSWSG